MSDLGGMLKQKRMLKKQNNVGMPVYVHYPSNVRVIDMRRFNDEKVDFKVPLVCKWQEGVIHIIDKNEHTVNIDKLPSAAKDAIKDKMRKINQDAFLHLFWNALQFNVVYDGGSMVFRYDKKNVDVGEMEEEDDVFDIKKADMELIDKRIMELQVERQKLELDIQELEQIENYKQDLKIKLLGMLNEIEYTLENVELIFIDNEKVKRHQQLMDVYKSLLTWFD